MLAKFSHHNLTQIKEKKVLVAVSGGIDSMVLLHLLQSLPTVSIGVVHIDHHTRKGKSSQDALFVSQYCTQNEIPLHIASYHHEEGNFQKNAREFRYKFLTKVSCEKNYDFIATAHHKDDHLESFLMGIIRGSGLWGIAGIARTKDKIIRPLLPFSRREIFLFADQYGIPYVEDSSNLSSDYHRNFLRNNVIPPLEKEIPFIKKKLHKSLELLQSDKEVLDGLVHHAMKPHLKKENGTLIIDTKGIALIPNQEEVLFHFLKKYGFTLDQIKKALHSKTGSVFYSNSWIMNKNRDKLILEKEQSLLSFVIEKPGRYNIGDQYELIISKEDLKDQITYHTYQELNEDKIHFPLILRLWQPGDIFQPLGMQGKHKKVKKFLTDLKLSRLEKMKTYVLTSNDNICYVIPYRIDEKFKVSDSSSIIRIYIKQKMETK